MNGEALYGVVGGTIGVFHDGQRDPMWSGKPDYMSEDGVSRDLTSHGRGTSLMKVQYFHVAVAEHQIDRMILLK
jgi:hypothetical protein